MWDSLTEEQRITLTIHEYCSISGVGIWFECLSMQLVLKDVYGEDPAQPHLQWTLTEIADECRHSVMFARTAEKFGAPPYQPPASILRLGKASVGRADGPAAHAAILAVAAPPSCSGNAPASSSVPGRAGCCRGRSTRPRPG